MTHTIDPSKDAEIEAFQTPKKQTCLDHAERAVAVARELTARGCRVLSLRANDTPPAWMGISDCSVEISEADIRRIFAGMEVEKTASTLRRQFDGVRVWCSIPEPPFVRPKVETVTL